jgi:hypothetical protein
MRTVVREAITNSVTDSLIGWEVVDSIFFMLSLM